jgi:hypothetical protein
MYWMKARNIPKYEAHFQKACLDFIAFLTDLIVCSSASSATCPIYICAFTSLMFASIWIIAAPRIATGARIQGLKRFGKGPDAVSMTVSPLQSPMFPAPSHHEISTVHHWPLGILLRVGIPVYVYWCSLLIFLFDNLAITLTVVTGCYTWCVDSPEFCQSILTVRGCRWYHPDQGLVEV